MASQKMYTLLMGSFKVFKRFAKVLASHVDRYRPKHSLLGTVFTSVSSPCLAEIFPNLDRVEMRATEYSEPLGLKETRYTAEVLSCNCHLRKLRSYCSSYLEVNFYIKCILGCWDIEFWNIYVLFWPISNFWDGVDNNNLFFRNRK